MTSTPEQNPTHRARWICLFALASLVFFSFYLGLNRIIQVDEALNVMMARLIATRQSGQFFTAAPLMLLGPLTWIAGSMQRSADIFSAFRCIFVALMWVNVLLMARATGVRLKSLKGLIVVLLAATLAPLWDYGFEIRHDVPLLTGVLGLWLVVRPPSKPWPGRMAAAGLLTGLLQFVAFKAFLYSVPMLLIALVLGSEGWKKPRLREIGELLLGIMAGLAVGRLLHGLAGTWGIYWNDFLDARNNAVNEVERFSPWNTLMRLPSQSPLFTAGGLAALGLPFLLDPKPTWKTVSGEPWFPEWLFAVLCVALFLINPTPFPYNLIHLVPAVFIAVVRFSDTIIETLASLPAPGRWFLAATALLAHGLPWINATTRHLEMDNQRQVQVMDLAEALTDPAKHRVLDGSGLVPTRYPAGRQWIIHSFTIRRLTDGTWPSVRQLITENEIPVILPSYRTSWLPEEDWKVIRANYLPLAEDFMVLGTIGQGGTHAWTPLAEGRYTVLLDGDASSQELKIDGREVHAGTMVLSRAPHSFEFNPKAKLVVIWMGPSIANPPRLAPAPHPLFVNWY